MKLLRIALAMLLAFSLSAGACAEGELSLKAQIGYDGLITYLRTMPLTVLVENQGRDFSGAIAVNLHVSNRYYDRYEFPISVASGAAKQVVLPLVLTMRQESYTVELVDEAGVVVMSTETRSSQVVDTSVMFVGVLSEGDSRLSYMNISNRATPGLGYEAWQTVALNAQTFPENGELLSAFQILVFDGVDARTLTDGQQAALRAWLEDGGIVIVGGGAQAAGPIGAHVLGAIVAYERGELGEVGPIAGSTGKSVPLGSGSEARTD